MVSSFGTRFGFDESTVHLSPAPLYYAAPLRTCATVKPWAALPSSWKFEPSRGSIERHRVTHSQWVPSGVDLG